MARSVSTDPPMNFRFGVKLPGDENWRGFQRIEIEPKGHPTGPGVVHLEKVLEPELIELLNRPGKLQIVVGIFHICDEINGPNPSFGATLNGVNPSKATMGKMILDAYGRDGRTVRAKAWIGGGASDGFGKSSRPGVWQTHFNQVLVARITVPYDSMEIKARDVKTTTNPIRSVKAYTKPMM